MDETVISQELKEIPTNNVLYAIPENADPLLIKHYEPPYNVYRRAKLTLFSSSFNTNEIFFTYSIDKKFDLIEKIENILYEYSIVKANEANIPANWNTDNFKDIYNVNCAKISANISQTNSVKNTYLPAAIFRNEIDICNLPKMTSFELYPEKYKSIISRLELSKNVVSTVKTTSMYTCRRCHKKECTLENRYNRSLDEGVNLTVTCVACGYEWNA